MNWGHGFVPRIHAGNYRPVDRSLEPPTLDGSNLDLPWAIVEAPWALKRALPSWSIYAITGPRSSSTLRLGDTGKPPPSLFPSTPTFPTLPQLH